MNDFTFLLLEWYNLNKRELPWKNNASAYSIWLSEIILQQTRVEQGKPYYLKFIQKYPTIVDLANDSIDNILKHWEGLGYYSRARNMHQTAIYIRDNCGGIFPNSYDEIRKLKGIGDYTAAAISSFAFKLPYAVVDGNVYRVLSRVLGMDTPIDSLQGKKYFQQKAQELLNKKKAAEHNQAIMDFGSLVCLPKNPKCNSCPFATNCIAYRQNNVSFFPVKSKKLIKKNRHFHYLVCTKNSKIILHHRNDKDIWKQLYDFPFIETESDTVQKNRLKDLGIKKLPKPTIYKQTLSHQNINAYFYELDCLIPQKANEIMVEIETIGQYAFPKIIRNYLKNKNLYLS